MRYPVALLVLGAALAGCGNSTSAPTKPTPTPGTAPPSHIDPVPRVTAGGKKPTARPTANPKQTPIRLPTVAPLPTPTAFPTRAYTAVISGTVTDAKTHAAIQGATVVVGAHLRKATTNSAGRYTVQFPVGPPVPVIVQAPGYGGAIAMGALTARRSITLNFKLNAHRSGKVPVPVPPVVFGQP